MVRFGTYAVLSLLATVATAWYAYETRLHFYPMVIYMATSKFSVIVLGNQALCTALTVARLATRAYLGALRAAELEVLYEKGKYAVTETLFALAIFTLDLSAAIFGIFGALLFVQAFHWVAESRIGHLDQLVGEGGGGGGGGVALGGGAGGGGGGGPSAGTYCRLLALLTTLLTLDLLAIGKDFI